MRISDWSSDVCSSDLRQGKILERHDRHTFGFSIARRMRDEGAARADGDEDQHRGFVLTLLNDAHGQAAVAAGLNDPVRSAERRVGKACVSKGRSRWSPYH